MFWFSVFDDVMMAAGIYVFFFLLCAGFVVDATVNCSLTGAGRHADPADKTCKNYTLCIYVPVTNSYLAYNTVCPSISLFNPAISKCTSPSNFVCNASLTVPKPPASTICNSDGFIPDPEQITNCSTYIQCVEINGAFTQLRLTCPENTFYNPNTTFCESDYVCKEFSCSSSGRIADTYDFTCKSYYYCVKLYNGTYAQFKYSCPSESVFNPVTKLCTTRYTCN